MTEPPMMCAYVAGGPGEPDRLMAAVPRCGLDYCDACGDCLECDGGNLCGRYGDDGHTWVVYRDQRQRFLDAHPEARPADDEQDGPL